MVFPNIDSHHRWKKQIFTEAEMLAQLEGVQKGDGEHDGTSGDSISGKTAYQVGSTSEGSSPQLDPNGNSLGGLVMDDSENSQHIDESAKNSSKAPGIPSTPLETSVTEAAANEPDTSAVTDLKEADHSVATNDKLYREQGESLSDNTTSREVLERSNGSYGTEGLKDGSSPPNRSTAAVGTTESSGEEEDVESSSGEGPGPTEQVPVPSPYVNGEDSFQPARSVPNERNIPNSASETATDGTEKERRGNRLRSIKGFVRRISDQSVVRNSGSGRPVSSGKST